MQVIGFGGHNPGANPADVCVSLGANGHLDSKPNFALGEGGTPHVDVHLQAPILPGGAMSRRGR